MPTRLLVAALSLLVPIMACAEAAPAQAEAVPSPFTPPEQPISLTRTVYRPLADGKQIVVTRRYEIRFAPADQGFRVDGTLRDVAVDAPKELASLAELERTRSDAGLFPVFLDRRGIIIGASGTAGDSALTERAVMGAEELLTDASLPGEVRREIATALKTIAGSAKGATWPPFLFNPGTAEKTVSHDIALPDGSFGHVNVRIRAVQASQGQLPQQVERTITTRLAQTERVSREIWTISN